MAAARQRPPDERLVVAVLAVGVGGVDEVDAQVEGVVQRGDRLGLVGGAVGAGHPPAAQADRRDLDAAPAQSSMLHVEPRPPVLRPVRHRDQDTARRGDGLSCRAVITGPCRGPLAPGLSPNSCAPMATFADLGIPFPLFEAPIDESSDYAGIGRPAACAAVKDRHCFDLGIGDALIRPCPACGVPERPGRLRPAGCSLPVL